MKKFIFVMVVCFLPKAVETAQVADYFGSAWKTYAPSTCTISNYLLMGVSSLNNYLIKTAALAGDPEAFLLYRDFLNQKPAADLICEMGAASVAQYAQSVVDAIFELHPNISKSTRSAINFIAQKAFSRYLQKQSASASPVPKT